MIRSLIKKNFYILFLFGVVALFFYPVFFKKLIPLPVDALVGAHVPWTEVKWEGYPAGVPIKNQEITDSISQFYPWRSFVGEAWRAGKIAFWNPYLFAGAPFLATLHSAVLYPLNFIYLFASDITSWNLLLFLQIFLAAIFMYYFLRNLTISKSGAVLGALTFAFSGYMIAWLEFATGGQAGLWLPLLLLFEFKYLKSFEKKYFLGIPLVFFCIYTAGDFQVPFYTTATYLLFGFYLTVVKEGLRKSGVANFLKIVLALGLGILLAAPQLFPAIELFGNSIRTDDPYIKEYFFGFMDWYKITNFIWPDFYGNVVTRNYWAEYGFHEYLGFTGVVSLVFATLSFTRKKSFVERFFWLLLTVSLLFLFPTPLAYIPFNLKIPGLGTSSASRILFLIDFSLAVLAAYGFSKWQKKENKSLAKIVFYFLVVTVGIGVGVLASIFYMQKSPYAPEVKMLIDLKVALKNMVPSTIILVFFFMLLFAGGFFAKFGNRKLVRRISVVFVILLASIELLRFAWKNTPFAPREFLFPKTQILDYLEKEPRPLRIAGPGIPLNYFMQYRINSVEGYDSMYPLRNAEWFSLVNFGDVTHIPRRYGEIAKFGSPLINYASVTHIIDYKKNPDNRIPGEEGVYLEGVDTERQEKVVEEGRAAVFKNNDALPKVWLTGEYEVFESKDQLIEKLTSLEKADKKVFLEEQPGFAGSLLGSYTISGFRQEFNTISFDIETQESGLLFLSESYYPGWSAYVDSGKTKIYRANYLFQAIVVPKGKHSILFEFYPKTFDYGKYFAIFSVIVLSIYGVKKRVE